MFNEFDPLAAKTDFRTEAAIIAIKREIQNILDCYVGWYDPFCELIQNALDSVEQQTTEISNDAYIPCVKVIINLKENTLTVSDNGTGLSKEKYEQFLAPSFSFKSGKTRGHKGVGATYIAYGFNYIQLCSRTLDFVAIGKMVDARKWLTDINPSGNPKVIPDSQPSIDSWFNEIKSGVSITVKFSKDTKPNELSWLNANTAEQWRKILSIKTAVGSIKNTVPVQVNIVVIAKNGKETSCVIEPISYLWPHGIVRKSAKLSDIDNKRKELFDKYGENIKMPSQFTNIDCIYDIYKGKEIENIIDCSDEEQDIINKYNPYIYFSYMYSTNVWQAFHNELSIRKNISILGPGIQIATNNMPQGELLTIPLKRNIGRQNQAHILIHYDNCRADLGRKGFQKELVEFSQSVAKKIIEKKITAVRKYMRKASGGPGNLARTQKVDNWKEKFKLHEEQYPLDIKTDCFFLPLKKISITSQPTREQDVIALFNQLLAGGVIRGIRIMSTNEHFTYDGMFRIAIEKPFENYIYDEQINPLGVDKDSQIFGDDELFISSPKILEYKFSLDGLIEDIESDEKNTNDIDLVVAWETGELYQQNYYITSLIDPDNMYLREFHGVTHTMYNINSNQKELDLIILSELMDMLVDKNVAIERQKEKYDNQ